MASEQNRWLSAEEIAQHLGVSIDTIYRWIAGRGMPAHKVGRLWKFKTDEVDKWVKAGGASADSSKEDVGKDSKK